MSRLSKAPSMSSIRAFSGAPARSPAPTAVVPPAEGRRPFQGTFKAKTFVLMPATAFFEEIGLVEDDIRPTM
jgi:hypothetical protein